MTNAFISEHEPHTLPFALDIKSAHNNDYDKIFSTVDHTYWTIDESGTATLIEESEPEPEFTHTKLEASVLLIDDIVHNTLTQTEPIKKETVQTLLLLRMLREDIINHA